MDTAKQTDEVRITDTVTTRIIRHQQALIGDKFPSRTASRIIADWHSRGLSLLPQPEREDAHTPDTTAA